MKFKEFLKKKKLAAGCVAAAAVITVGSLSMVWQDSQVPELPNYTDPVVEQTITDDDTPLASAPKVTTKTTKSTKTSKKNIKLKKASTKTYTKTLPTKKSVTSKTAKKNSTTTVKTQTTVQTATSQKYTKKSKTVVQTQKVTTTVKTTTTVVAASVSANKTSSGSTAATANTASKAKAQKYTISSVAAAAPKMDSRVLNAYTKMGFTVSVDSSVSYAGYFNAASRSITLRTEDNTIYHELGHYLAFIAGNVDKSSAFASVYNSEKSKFTGVNKAYATQNASEYFAESVLDYVENPTVLKTQRPKTYEAIQQALDKVTDERVDKIIKVYSAVWK